MLRPVFFSHKGHKGHKEELRYARPRKPASRITALRRLRGVVLAHRLDFVGPRRTSAARPSGDPFRRTRNAAFAAHESARFAGFTKGLSPRAWCIVPGAWCFALFVTFVAKIWRLGRTSTLPLVMERFDLVMYLIAFGHGAF